LAFSREKGGVSLDFSSISVKGKGKRPLKRRGGGRFFLYLKKLFLQKREDHAEKRSEKGKWAEKSKREKLTRCSSKRPTEEWEKKSSSCVKGAL